ncbi:MAG: RluA family pseudouridine synthase [Firmicutes bacterium]|nr:RluA family pseudouridine synthase [Bacillota bacterium]
MNKLNVLYEDNHIIVVEKLPNILSQADNTGDKDLLTMVKEYIKEKYNKPGNVYLGLVHRLDRPVGGIMVFARTSKAASRLSEEIRSHKFKKTYLAIVNGIIKKDSDRFVDKLERISNGNTIVSGNGKESILEYKVLDRNYEQNKTLVEIKLETGRHHQIRVQFASRGYPLAGDQRYGSMDKTQIALYAYKLEFVHPTTKENMYFEKFPDKKDYWTLFTL